MADHTALPTRASRFGDLCARLRKHLPEIVRVLTILTGWIALGQIMFEYRQWTAGVWATLGGPFLEVLVICWRWMVAAWPDLAESPAGKDQ
jgi:hypothetical protein